MAFPFSKNRMPEGIDPNRIPPGQTLTARHKWPVLSFGPTPRFDAANWDFRVVGLVEEELRLDYAGLRALPSRDHVADVHCVTGWSRLGDTWTGVPIQQVLDRVRPLPEARYVMAFCDHAYTTGLPLEVLADSDVMLCYGWNGADLTPDHGYPLRLLIPKKYFWKSAKWLRGLEFLKENRLGFWEQRGYHDGADPWTEQRYW